MEFNATNTYRKLHTNGTSIDDTVESYVLDEQTGELVLKILTPEDIEKKQW